MISKIQSGLSPDALLRYLIEKLPDPSYQSAAHQGILKGLIESLIVQHPMPSLGDPPQGYTGETVELYVRESTHEPRTSDRDSAIAKVRQHMAYVFAEAFRLSGDATDDFTLCEQVYVWPRARTLSKPGNQPLRTQMEQFLQDTTQRVSVLLGDPGMGKSQFGKRWLRALSLAPIASSTEVIAGEVIANPAEVSVPPKPDKPLVLFITLASIRREEIENPERQYLGLLEYYLEKEVCLTREEVITLKRDVPFIVYCDGVDENTLWWQFISR